MKIFITLTKLNTPQRRDEGKPLLAVNYLISIPTLLTIVSNVFIRNGTYQSMFIGTLYNTHTHMYIYIYIYIYIYTHFCIIDLIRRISTTAILRHLFLWHETTHRRCYAIKPKIACTYSKSVVIY